MEKNLSAYLFVRQGKLQKSPAGERDLNRGELATVKAFFEAGRQSELYTLLQRLLCRMRRFRELRRHDYAIEPADCVEDLCAQAPVMASALTKARRKLNCGTCFCRRNINGRLCFPAAAY